MNDSLARTRYRIGDVGIPDLRHFLYKAKSTAQYTSPEFEAPYQTEEDQARIFYLYHYLHGRIHNTARPLKILFHVGQYETLLGWVSFFPFYLDGLSLQTYHLVVFISVSRDTLALVHKHRLILWGGILLGC